MAKFPEISHFFNLHDSSLGRHVTQKLRNSSVAKICMKISFQLF